ncbi:MAG: exodeoxyribonuclease VII large subunit [Candidatus Lloydbacteria bacterium RIFCSPHIGHO2_02_FULL_54_17]|uniref:Exodeoxyribonuclease 7 large subunit n=1 Tax=Candidatus Lloydbacteria bacterium RIFCSPHIGHO2_02_FULL_54_17 TaxID=1798664 RepID=A0A1G2DG52_9BACT|nr:MAG: exodeoxyribonuclease VII large subunit [Candidatus Lloydbacteria bacterium RIFCSPHIGHO2_01_FULL_54_11]OGZ11931.1 MAG: exodeoxyribonuclease VII large subunit [Candidatus Lloydbacteria bacterium RIFCSPHIGHO2_02_FULL_54_17]OGZ15076.1 MAG: exodeoxyribonuclease VII large subunit [Candidatus Lloydbacteria bacterium RIFCSPLOWO2_02_FULL_54_12]
MANLRQTLYAWRDAEAAKLGVELFRVLPNNALDEIVKALPRTKDELTAIKGIKEAKYREFGKVILAMVDEHAGASHQLSDTSRQSTRSDLKAVSPRSDLVLPDLVPLASEETTFSVSAYLDIVNRELYRIRARVVGEVTSIKFQGSAVYIGLKDAEDESALSVFMWEREYATAGIEVAAGMAVAVEGRSDVYKPTGRLSFRAETIELVGEGALKKAYDALKKKLDEEGVFAPEKKRPLSEYPERIGLITSKTGAVIHDFLNNLGKFGFKVRFTDARVEGAAAVKEILAAIKYFSEEEIDALVIIRGGGSLESLQAFNNERVVRAIAEFPRPTIVAIGHDKDVPLAQLVADHAPSTPTAATVLLNRSWDEGVHTMRYFIKDISALYQGELWANKERLGTLNDVVRAAFAEITMRFSVASREFSEALLLLGRWFTKRGEMLRREAGDLVGNFHRALLDAGREVGESSRLLQLHNPLRQLRLGYSILSKGGKVVRSAKDLPAGTHFEARLSDGTIEAQTITHPRSDQKYKVEP